LKAKIDAANKAAGGSIGDTTILDASPFKDEPKV